MYNISVRPGRTPCINAYDDLMENSVFDYSQFENNKDTYVKLCFRIDLNIRRYKLELCTRWGIEETEDLQDERIIEQDRLFKPPLLRFKKFQKLYQSEALLCGDSGRIVDCLHSYLCAITVQSSTVPMDRQEQFNLCDQCAFRGSNLQEEGVYFLNELIFNIIDDVNEYEKIIERRIRWMGG